jgi:uncharacterized membrane protein
MNDNIKRTLPFLLDALHLLALAVWLGGLLTLWLAVMPAAFHGSANLTLRQSETVIGDALRGFTSLVEICGLTMIGAQFLLRRRYQRDRRQFIVDGGRQLLTFGALLLAEICLRSLLPQMDAARAQVHLAEFHQIHQSYAALATAQAIALIGVGLLTAWLQSPPKVER